MTGQSRFVQKSQITLFVALLMALCFLMFNYWNLSKQNVDLSYEYKKLFDKFAKTSIDIKKVTDDHAVVRKQYIEMLEELKKINVESDILKVKVKEKSENVLKMQKNLNGKESQLSLIQSDMVRFIRFISNVVGNF